MIRTWLGAWLVVALLGAWHGALLHPLEHLDEHGRFIHLGGADGGDARGENERQDGPLNPSDRLGDLLAAVAACVAGLAGIVFAVPQAVEAFLAPQADELRHAPLLAYRSQAPPQYS